LSITTLLSLVEKAEDDVILKSRKHCHAKSVSSVVLAQSGNKLFRAFLAWPGHELEENRPGGRYPVGVHDHRYDLTISLICGHVENVVYEAIRSFGPDEVSPDLHWPNAHMQAKWRFTSGVESGVPSAERVGLERIREESRLKLPEYGSVYLTADTLHDIECSGVCGWYVLEGGERKKTTTLYTNGPFDTAGLYEPFGSKAEVVEHVLVWAEEARK
jgi:hypothetical protein